MTVDPAVIPGLLLLAAELLTLSAVGYVVARVALRQTDDRLALAQGLVIGLALWGLIVNFVLHLLPGLAGALASWIIVLALGAGLAWRTHKDLGVPPRTLAGFGLAGAAIFWIALASRQLLIVPDEVIHTSLAATIRAGAWPPTLAWNPNLDLAYHHGVDLLVALLTPPTGPDLAFTTEILGAYFWTSLILLSAMLIMKHGSWIGVIVLTPLILAEGAWTLVFGEQPSLLQIPVLTGVPSAGLRAELVDIYWPNVELPWRSEQHGVPPNIWKPPFPFAYALAFVVLERVAARGSLTWSSALTLSVLIGFLGLVDETVAPMVLALWGVMEVGRLLSTRRVQSAYPATILRVAAGPILAAVLLAAGGGVLTGVLTGSGGTGALSVGWPLDPRSRGAVSSFTSLAGGGGLLQLGTLVVASAAVLLDRRSRHLSFLLVAGSAAFLVAALTLRYEAAPYDIARFDGHARNFALLALLLALSVRLSTLRPRWRYAAAAGVFVLVVWPTIATPSRKVGLAVGHGIEVANARPGLREFDAWYWWMGRYSLDRFPSDRVASWLRDQSHPRARVLSPMPFAMTIATGRPNAAGFAQFPHARPTTGPEYLDSIRHLEPAALRRLDIAYVHAPDSWVAGLPDRAASWLADPAYFDPVIRDGAHALYRVNPAFLQLVVEPAPGSYEALRQAIPTSSTVYVSPATDSLNAFRAVAALPHTRLLGGPGQSALMVTDLHLRSDIEPAPLDGLTPDFVLTSARLAPSMFPPDARRPIFWNKEVAIYSPTGAVEPVGSAPPRPFSVRLSHAREVNGRVAFTATLTETTGQGWTGQDWLVVPADTSPWALPLIRPTDIVEQWFAGQATPQLGTTVHRFEFDPLTATLALRGNGSSLTKVSSSGDGVGSGVWLLGLRLRSEYQLVAFIPAVRIEVSATGEVSYEVFEGDLAVQPTLGPIASTKGRF